MAFTKKQKTEMMTQYEKWVSDSQAVFVLEYKHMDMKSVDMLRRKVREAGGELHVIKNSLMKMAMEHAGIQNPEFLEGTSVASFAFSDPAAMAKVINEATEKSEIFKVKGGFLGSELVSAKQVKSLADLPTLPVMRSMLLGVLVAPATKLVRTLAEPARSVASVIKAYSDKEAAPAA